MGKIITTNSTIGSSFFGRIEVDSIYFGNILVYKRIKKDSNLLLTKNSEFLKDINNIFLEHSGGK